jgi:Zn-dependent protease
LDWNQVAVFVARALALCIAIPFHEAAHALVSYRLGDPTAKNCGRLSLNPLRHFDPWGALCMLATGFGWARPVPVAAQTNFKHPRRDMALSAAAGPASNLLLAYVCTVLYKLVYYAAPRTEAWAIIGLVLSALITVNMTLAVFNLLPVPPLDGSRIITVFLPVRLYFKIMRYEKYIVLVLFALLLFGVLDTPLSWVYTWVWRGLNWSTGYINLLVS